MSSALADDHFDGFLLLTGAMDEVAEAVSLYSDLARQYEVKPSPLIKEI